MNARERKEARSRAARKAAATRKANREAQASKKPTSKSVSPVRKTSRTSTSSTTSRNFPNWVVWVLVAAVVILVLVAWAQANRYSGVAQTTATPAATAANTQAPAATAANTQAPAPAAVNTQVPVIQTAQPGNSGGSYQTFTYIPGGESFGAIGRDVTNPAGESDCFRVWQATNLKNTAWTVVFCNWKASSTALKQQWPHPMQLTVSGSGTVEFDMYRDLAASKTVSPDPYVVANVQNSPLGLGWFTQGFNGSTCVDGVCEDLSGGGVFQMSFPKDWTGHYHVVITVNNGQVQFWQGERATSTDNWPTP